MTEDNQNKTDKLFHDALADMEAQPSPAIWDKVEAVLDGEDRRRPIAWWWWTGAFILLVGSAAAWYFWPTQNVPREYFIQGLSQDGSLKPSNDSSFATNYRVKNVLPNEVRQELQRQADSINSVPADAKTSGKTIPATQKSNTVIANSNLTHTSVKPNTSPVIATNLFHSTNVVSKPSGTNNTAVDVKTKSIKKDSAASPPIVKKKEQPIVTSNKTTSISGTTNTNLNSNPKADSSNKKPQHALPVIAENSTNNSKITTSAKKLATDSVDKKSLQASTNHPLINTSVRDYDSTIARISGASTLAAMQSMHKLDSLKKDSIIKVAKKDSVAKAAKTNGDSVHALIMPHLFSLALFYAPEIARNDVTANNAKFNIQNAKPNTRYAIGIKFGISFSNKLEANIGLAYSQFNQTMSPDTISFPKGITQPFVFNTSLGDLSVPAATMMQGYSPPPWVSRVRYHYQYSETVQFINMPINVRLNFGTGKLKPYATAGINILYALSSSATLDLLKELTADNELTYNNLNVNKINIATSAGLGLEYNIKKRFSVFIEPNARLNMLSFSGSTKSLNYFMGCQGGIKLGL